MATMSSSSLPIPSPQLSSTAAGSSSPSAVAGHKFSTVVPGNLTGDDVTHELGNLDLAMKLHYVRGFYCFSPSSVVAGLSVLQLKAPMFHLLSRCPHVAARLRTSDEGRPFLKCNDSGIRIVEAFCDADLNSWLLQTTEASREKGLVPLQVLGPQLQFSPLVFVQFTRFSCGGIAIGFSWSHILGDASAAACFFNTWGELLAGKELTSNLTLPSKTKEVEQISSSTDMPLSIKQVQPSGDCWVGTTDQKMESYTFRITDIKLKLLKTMTSARSFESISALIWKCLTKIRNRKPTMVNICRCLPKAKSCEFLGNQQTISTLTVDSSSITNLELSDLAWLLAEDGKEENKAIERWIDADSGGPDILVYGANLTFVDMEEVCIYGLELKGQDPILADYTIGGVGDEGAVVVHRGTREYRVSTHEMIVSVILPEDEILSLRRELSSAWGIA